MVEAFLDGVLCLRVPGPLVDGAFCFVLFLILYPIGYIQIVVLILIMPARLTSIAGSGES